MELEVEVQMEMQMKSDQIRPSSSINTNSAVPPNSSNLTSSSSTSRYLEALYDPVSGKFIGFNGFPTYLQCSDLISAYIDTLSDVKKSKCLISRDMYHLILAILSHPHKEIGDSQFRFWAKANFSLYNDPKGRPQVMYKSKPIAVREDLYNILAVCHMLVDHGGRDRTLSQLRKWFSRVPKNLVSQYVKVCPTCNPSTVSVESHPELDVCEDLDDIYNNSFQFCYHQTAQLQLPCRCRKVISKSSILRLKKATADAGGSPPSNTAGRGFRLRRSIIRYRVRPCIRAAIHQSQCAAAAAAAAAGTVGTATLVNGTYKSGFVPARSTSSLPEITAKSTFSKFECSDDASVFSNDHYVPSYGAPGIFDTVVEALQVAQNRSARFGSSVESTNNQSRKTFTAEENNDPVILSLEDSTYEDRLAASILSSMSPNASFRRSGSSRCEGNFEVEFQQLGNPLSLQFIDPTMKTSVSPSSPFVPVVSALTFSHSLSPPSHSLVESSISVPCGLNPIPSLNKLGRCNNGDTQKQDQQSLRGRADYSSYGTKTESVLKSIGINTQAESTELGSSEYSSTVLDETASLKRARTLYYLPRSGTVTKSRNQRHLDKPHNISRSETSDEEIVVGVVINDSSNDISELQNSIYKTPRKKAKTSARACLSTVRNTDVGIELESSFGSSRSEMNVLPSSPTDRRGKSGQRDL
ncbi:uncharacterized protein V1516DRAFT_679459 [Lipomyces oligophaga]|uniref:uncharacterized protein n=1 Tax=Lipomyces oligophaga TaxID=45792 RepID=UPI0034CEDFC2